MNRLSLSAMSFAGLGLLLIAGAGVASAGRMQDAGKACARIADDVRASSRAARTTSRGARMPERSVRSAVPTIVVRNEHKPCPPAERAAHYSASGRHAAITDA